MPTLIKLLWEVAAPAFLLYQLNSCQTFNVAPQVNLLNVELKERLTNLREVVVTGLATTVKRSNAANAVASLNVR